MGLLGHSDFVRLDEMDQILFLSLELRQKRCVLEGTTKKQNSKANRDLWISDRKW